MSVNVWLQKNAHHRQNVREQRSGCCDDHDLIQHLDAQILSFSSRLEQGFKLLISLELG